MKRKILIYTLFIIWPFCFSIPVYSYDDTSFENIYKEQIEISGADDLEKQVPEETKESLNNIGVIGIDWDDISNISPDKVFAEILNIAKKKSYKPLTSFSIIVSIIILCALFDGMKTSFGSNPLSNVLGVVSTLCICACVVAPIVECINNLSSIIQNSSNFMLLYVPVITGIMISSGQALSAGNYNFMMVILGDTISQIVSRLLVPMLNMVLAVAVVSSISSKLNLSGVSDMFNKVVKWILKFIMAIFVSLLTIQTFVSTAADNIGIRSIKFAINSFVPIVGGALSDAYTTVFSCLKLLKSGVGAFAILASGFIFLPPIIECFIWLFSLGVSASFSDIFGLMQISKMLRSSSKIVSTMLVILLCIITILIVSTGIVLTVGGGQ